LRQGRSEVRVLAENALYLLFTVVALGKELGEGEEHPLFEEWSSNGVLNKMWKTFQKCKFSNGKKNLCLAFVYLHHGREVEEKYKEMVDYVGGRCDESGQKRAVEETEDFFRNY
jgi:hypothetical protein